MADPRISDLAQSINVAIRRRRRSDSLMARDDGEALFKRGAIAGVFETELFFVLQFGSDAFGVSPWTCEKYPRTVEEIPLESWEKADDWRGRRSARNGKPS